MKDRSGHVLATVVFTDIVDSSTLAHDLGDARWRVLLSRHHEIVRKALKRHGGREVDNAGDGFFAAFDDQADAIRCACAISDGVKVLGVNVRVGCHVGQAEVVGRKLGGVTVHAGARVMSEAHPGEVLVSAVMKDLVPASGFTFADRGVHTLKGIDGEWRLFAVTAVDGSQRPPPVEPEEAAHLRQEIQPLPIVQRRAGRLGIAAVALLVAVVATGAAFAFAHRPRPIVVQPNSLVKIDPTSNEVAADVPLAVQPGTSQITAVPPDRIWVMSQLDQVIAVVDTNSNSQVKVCPGIRGQEANTPGVQVAGEGIVYADGSVWASGPQNKLDLLEPSTCEPGSPVALEGTPDLLSEGYGRVWVVSHDIMRVYAVDPTSGSVKPTARIGVDDSGVAVGEGAVWVSNGGDGTISKIDPQTGTTTPIPIWYRRTVNGTKERMQAFPSGIGTAFSSVWLADAPNAVVYRIDPATNKIIDTIQIGQPTDPQFIWLSTIVAADGSLWVTSPASKAIVRIDPTTDRVTNSISVPYTPRSLVSANGSVWVTVEAE